MAIVQQAICRFISFAYSKPIKGQTAATLFLLHLRKLMKLELIFISLFFLTFSCQKIPFEINCSIDIDSIEKILKNELKADSAKIYSKSLKEEIYFPKIVCINVIITNATTPIIDFKPLSTEKCERFKSTLALEDSLTVFA